MSLFTKSFWFKDTSPDVKSLPLIERSDNVLTTPRKLVAPLISRAKLDEMSLLIATELFPAPTSKFWFMETSELNRVAPKTFKLDPRSVNNPVADTSTVVVALFVILIALFLPIVMLPVDPEPSIIRNCPLVCTALAKNTEILSAIDSAGSRPT